MKFSGGILFCLLFCSTQVMANKLLNPVDNVLDDAKQVDSLEEFDQEFEYLKAEEASVTSITAMEDVKKQDNSCSSHTNCTACTTESHTCHWCASGNACHEIGSLYGCAWGATCSHADPGEDDDDLNPGNHTDPDPDNDDHTDPVNPPKSDACHSIDTCKDCSSTWTCHWCEADQACHAEGSVHGCAFGGICTPPKPKENSTCASQTTCSDCAVSSHLCHWCEHDNACHAVGSRFGCTSGVDCYSNDRCRRTQPEKFKSFIFSEISMIAMLVVIVMGLVICACLSCCFFCVGGVKGAYDDLATITMAASLPPSVIGGTLMGPSEPFYTELSTHEEGDEEAEEAEESQPVQARNTKDEEANEQAETPKATTQNPPPRPTGRQEEDGNDNYYLLVNDEPRPILPSLRSHTHMYPASIAYGMGEWEEPTHMSRLYKMCTACYYFSIFVISALVVTAIFFYPQAPKYDICNDAVAWKSIMGNIASFKLDASFEILISLRNPNHLDVALDKGSGVFRFDGNQVGTFEIPPVFLGAMAITDLMIVTSLRPDKYQAVQIAEAYYRGKLDLDADFKASLRVPALNDFKLSFEKNDFVVHVNELSDRSLCHCPSWDDGKNHTSDFLFF
jgi:hypothetical protein